MTINKIKGNNYGPNKTERSGSSSKSSGAGNTAKSSDVNAGSKSKEATNVSLSGSKFENEVSFAKNILSNARQDSMGSLKKIKQKINAGAYNTEAVHKEIRTFVEKDLSSLQDLFPAPSTEKTTPSILTTERKENLLENPEVKKTVAGRIAEQLRNL